MNEWAACVWCNLRRLAVNMWVAVDCEHGWVSACVKQDLRLAINSDHVLIPPQSLLSTAIVLISSCADIIMC